MTLKELTSEVEQLSQEELLQLLEMVTRLLREALSAQTESAGVLPFESLRGILKTDGPIPTDEELKEDYVNYLIRKYA